MRTTEHQTVNISATKSTRQSSYGSHTVLNRRTQSTPGRNMSLSSKWQGAANPRLLKPDERGLSSSGSQSKLETIQEPATL